MKFIIYTDKSGDVRWKLEAKNGRIVADSGEGYHSEGNARRAIKATRAMISNAEIEVIKKQESES